MKNTNSKITKISRKPRLNPGMLVFLFIFLYILIYFIFYLRKDHLTLYQVTESDISRENTYVGLILRDETVYKTDTAGYVAYYATDKTRVKVNQTVYSIDENGDTLKTLNENNASVLKKDDYKQLNSTISEFTEVFDATKFDSVYDFKNVLNNKIFEVTSGARYNNLEEQLNNSTNVLDVVSSDKAGTISYYIDGMENLKKKNVSDKYFNDYDYKYSKLTTGTLVKKNSPVYKMLNSETWNIYLKLNEEQYKQLKEKELVKIVLNNNSKLLRANIKCNKKNGSYFACLTLYKYAVEYFNQRYVSVEIILDNTTGLKIPNTSITEKEFYEVPQEFFSYGGNSNSLGVTALLPNEEGVAEYMFTETVIYNKSDDTYYINKNLFTPGTQIVSTETNESYTLNATKTLKGVFVANNGYCEFKQIKIIDSNDEYSIVEKNTQYGISAYDNIVLKASTALENKII